MSENNSASRLLGSGFLGRKHYKLRFTELDEIFFARLILRKCPDPTMATPVTVQLSLCDLFRRFAQDELEGLLENVTFPETSKIGEILEDTIFALFGPGLKAAAKEQPALDYYHAHIRTRLGWLQSGDETDGRLPCVDAVTSELHGKLLFFQITVRPAVLRERLGEQIPAQLEFAGRLVSKLIEAQHRPDDIGPRIDFRKQVEMLCSFIDRRQKLTGEVTFSILSNDIPFRWALNHLNNTDVTLPAVGTSDVRHKLLLPLFLEVNGLLDVIDLDIESDPRQPHDVVVRYAIHRPATRNIFGAHNGGLAPEIRSQLNETELTVYHRLHDKIRDGLVFGGKPLLESSFGTIGAWLIRKAAFCLEEPNFLGRPARHWLKRHEADKTLQMEDEFFLPALYERLRDNFGTRVVKKPERFGGEIDILFDDAIPIELKVRRGRKKPLPISDVDETFRPSGQAAVYAGVSRLGFVAVLDLPDTDSQMISLENCVTVVERRFPDTAEYPTCILVIVFRCYQLSPSLSH